MSKKLQTIDLKGKAYAQVAVRIREFREMCPNGLIEPTPTFLADNKVSFKTRILKDKANQDASGEGTGHSYGSLVKKDGSPDEKAFEKLETISVGRALAMLGFMASGEVASFDEMEDFLSEKELKRQEKIQEVRELVDNTDSIEELRVIFKNNRGFGVEVDQYIMSKVESLKK